MYSDNEIETAVASGAIDRAAAIRLRASIAQQRGTSPVDEEQFRLVTSFNDIFVTIAAGLVIFATTTLIGGLGTAIVSWGLAEYFTRRKRMALPSIFLLLTFAGGLFFSLSGMIIGDTGLRWYGGPSAPNAFTVFGGFALAGLLTTAGVAAHWRRFRVPITIAAGATALAVVVGSVFMLSIISLGIRESIAMRLLPWFVLLMGVAMFCFAMKWDLSDPERVTRRSDVAFWLHLAASPLIVHPLFIKIGTLGVDGGGMQYVSAMLALMLYAGLAVVALIVDRRAVLVSALVYVVVAIGVIMGTRGAITSNFALSGAVIGALLLTLSVFWRPLRIGLLRSLPEGMRSRLPIAGRPTAGG